MKTSVLKRLGSVVINLGTCFVASIIALLAGTFQGQLDGVILVSTSIPLALTFSFLGGNLTKPFSKWWQKLLVILSICLVATVLWTILAHTTQRVLWFTDFPLPTIWFCGILAQLLFLEFGKTVDPILKFSVWKQLLVSPFIMALMTGVTASGLFAYNQASEIYYTPSEEKLEWILKSDDIRIEYHSYGGFAGHSLTEYRFKCNELDTLLISNEGSDHQTYTYIDAKQLKDLETFLRNALRSHDPDLEMSGSCMHFNQEYYVRGGLTSIHLKPADYDTLAAKAFSIEGALLKSAYFRH